MTILDPNQRLLAPTWPFTVERSPVFYGWIIWAVSTLGFLMSVPGQTMGLAVFTDWFIDAFGLSRTQLAIAYFFGTVASALILTHAGKLYDRYGARMMLVGSSLLLGVVLVFVSNVDVMSEAISRSLGIEFAVVSFPLILIGYFGARFAGQGVLYSAANNMLLVWFEKRRGLVTGIRGIFVSLGFSIAPLLLAALIGAYGWRASLLVLAATVGIGYVLFALVFARDGPEECGLYADGASHPPTIRGAGGALGGATLAEARRDPVFWIYALSLSAHALFGTAITFHIVSLFAEYGRPASEAFGYFLPVAIVSVAVNLLASAVADYTRLKPHLVTMLSLFLLGTLGLLSLDTDLGYWVLTIGFGAGSGLWIAISTLAFIRFFGRAHLGAITGLNASIMVFASAIGPVLFSVLRDFSGSYSAAIYACATMLAVLLAAGIIIAQPDPKARRWRALMRTMRR